MSPQEIIAHWRKGARDARYNDPDWVNAEVTQQNAQYWIEKPKHLLQSISHEIHPTH